MVPDLMSFPFFMMATWSQSFSATSSTWVEKKMDGSDSYELVNDDQLVMTAGTYNHPAKGSPFDERSTEYREGKR